MHRAVEHKSLEAMRTLLELGASPNYKDGKGITALYLTITQNVDHQFTETLLHDHATIGAQDLQGWQEVHQVFYLYLHVLNSQTFFSLFLIHLHCKFYHFLHVKSIFGISVYTINFSSLFILFLYFT